MCKLPHKCAQLCFVVAFSIQFSSVDKHLFSLVPNMCNQTQQFPHWPRPASSFLESVHLLRPSFSVSAMLCLSEYLSENRVSPSLGAAPSGKLSLVPSPYPNQLLGLSVSLLCSRRTGASGRQGLLL